MKRTDVQREVKMLGQALQIGQSVRTQCPVCRDKESSFSVTRHPHGLLYNCFRASCDPTLSQGFAGTIPNACEPYNPDKLAYCQRMSQPYEGELYPLEQRDYDYFSERFDLQVVPPYTVMRSSANDAEAQYVMTLEDYRGYPRGHAVRRGGWTGSPRTPGRVDNIKPKTKTYMLRADYLAQHVAMPNGDKLDRGQVVIVEDYISSLKVAQAGLVGVALMGTHMNGARAEEIRKLAPRKVTIALDRDATVKAMRMAREWGLSWESTTVRQLVDDIKDMPRFAVQELLW